MRLLVQIAQKQGEKKERDGRRAMIEVHQGEDQGAADDRPPTSKTAGRNEITQRGVVDYATRFARRGVGIIARTRCGE